MIRVLHVLDKLGVDGSQIHGVGRAISWWIPRFSKQDFDFHVVSLRAPEPAGKVFEDEGIAVTYLSKGKFDPTTIPALLKVIREYQPHILHLHGFGSTTFGRIVSAISGVPNIVHEHTVIDDQPIYQTFADALLSPLTTKAIAISSPVYDYMVQKRKIRPELLSTFFYGVPLDDFQPSSDEVVAQKAAALGLTDEPVICCVGRLDTQKGQQYLVEAAAQVVKNHPKAKFLIVGDGPHETMLKELAHTHQIADNIIFTGYRTDIPDLLKMSHIIALPSLWEGGPITLFEAMQIGKAVIGTPVGLMPVAIQEGLTGYLVPIKTVDPLAQRLDELLSNPEKVVEMGRKAKEASKNYDLLKSVQQLGDIYKRMAKNELELAVN